MNNPKIIKLLTLSGFCILLSAFVGFKAGIFNKYLATESVTVLMPKTDQAMNVNAGDTVPILRLGVRPIRVSPSMLSTSKSLILVDQKIKFSFFLDSLKNDTVRLKQKK